MSTSATPNESCQDPNDSSVGMEGALRIIQQQIQPVQGGLAVTLREAWDRVLAKAVVSPLDVPPHRNSAMDGYALAASDLPEAGKVELEVVGNAFAGKPYRGRLEPGECVRIMTGAKMPDETDTVVIQEQAELVGGKLRIGSGHKPGQNVRQPGEDIARDTLVLEAGGKLGAAEIGLLASLGIGEVTIRRRLRVALFSSGDEIRSIGDTLGEGEIYDSNRYTLYGMLRALNVDVLDMGVIPDNEESILQALREAAGQADLILTSGGVSVGEADYIASTLRQQGVVHFSKVAIKPGRPLTFGQLFGAYFFGLPGNPVAVMTTFLQFVRPAIKWLSGEVEVFSPCFQVRTSSRLRKQPGRTEFQRGVLEQNPAGDWVVRTTGRQGSGVLSSMGDGNCFILLPESCAGIEPGDMVAVQPFSQFET